MTPPTQPTLEELERALKWLMTMAPGDKFYPTQEQKRLTSIKIIEQAIAACMSDMVPISDGDLDRILYGMGHRALRSDTTEEVIEKTVNYMVEKYTVLKSKENEG